MTKYMVVSLVVFLHGVVQASETNFVVVLLDDTGFGDISVFNQSCPIQYLCPTTETRNLDRLATEGTVWTNFYAAAVVCSPSRAGLLTGRYPIRTSVFPDALTPQSLQGLPESETTIAQVLRENGYYTAVVGKWHLGHAKAYNPLKHGFQHWMGMPYSHDYCPCSSAETNTPDTCNRDFDPPCPMYEGFTITEQPVALETVTERYVDRVVQHIDLALDQGKPFFVYYALQHTHHPQFVNLEHVGISARLGYRADAYGDALQEMDMAIGVLLDALHERGLHDSTILFLSSDNGPSVPRGRFGGSPGQLRCGKGTTWEGGQRVGGIAWGQGIPAGVVSNDIISSIDIFPTILALANVSYHSSRKIDGLDFSKRLIDPEHHSSPRDNFIYYGLNPVLNAVRVENYKMHFYTSSWNGPKELCELEGHGYGKQDPPLLFDLDRDPGENHPIPPNSTIYREAKRRIEDLIKKHGCSEARDKGCDLSPPMVCAQLSESVPPFPPKPFHPWIPNPAICCNPGQRPVIPLNNTDPYCTS